MIREVTYYQAVCDVCGAVDDGGEFSAWADPDSARMSALDGDDWTEVEAAVLPGITGPAVYKISGDLDQPPRCIRSILICAEHHGDGVEWCRDCDEDLPEDAWNMTPDGHAEQACPNGHWNAITPRENPR